MRELVLARRAGALAVAAACGALVAAPALADVTVSPATAAQATGQDFAFHVTNTGSRPIGTVTLKMPDDAPVAEVYPLSNDDWAPRITTRTLSEALPTEHGGIPTTETTSAITWIAMPGHALAAGRSADLRISLGPLPTLSSLRLTISTAYADGKPGPAMTPLDIALTPATAQQLAAEHAGHEAAGGAVADDPDAAENARFAKVVGDATRGPSVWTVLGWIVAAAGVLVGAGLMIRSRHRAEEDEEPEDDEATPTARAVAATGDDQEAAGNSGKPAVDGKDTAEDGKAGDGKEPVAAGKWSLKG